MGAKKVQQVEEELWNELWYIRDKLHDIRYDFENRVKACGMQSLDRIILYLDRKIQDLEKKRSE